MSLPKIFIFVAFIALTNSNWKLRYKNLFEDKKFTSQVEVDYLLKPSMVETANFITCATPPSSYFTLNSTYPPALDSSYLDNGFFVQYLCFIYTWMNQTVTFNFQSFSYPFYYTSQTNQLMKTGFCDDIAFEVKTVNFIIKLTNEGSRWDYLQFISSNTNDGQVSIRNIFVSAFDFSCYPACSQCTGIKFNQCTRCYYGLPTNNICPPCPTNLYFEKGFGCRNICHYRLPLYANGFCQYFQIKQFIGYHYGWEKYGQWFNIYDPLHLDTSPKLLGSTYEVFRFNSGLYTYFNLASHYVNDIFTYGLSISIKAYNDIPINCGILFLINNTYIGSIYRNESGIQTHKMKIYSNLSFGSYLNYTSNRIYQLITYIDLPKQPFIFSAVGNYSDSTAGWGLSYFTVTSGYCPESCKLCEVSFKCKTCQSGYYLNQENICISSCSNPNLKSNGSYCYDAYVETPYSEYLTQDFIDYVHDPEQYAQYTLISQNGSNFLKGSDIFYSNLFWNYAQLWQRIFGGPFIWAQAKFQRIHNINDPHHSITLAFDILYGPDFPSDGLFIYTVENNTSVSKSTSSYKGSYSNNAKYDRVYERITHETNTLTISWECFGPNNEPVKAYCGFYNYYISVHKCQPFCLLCLNETNCQQWSSDYDVNVVKFSNEDCLINQYFAKDSYKCLDCPISCLTCISQIDCQTCKPTFTLNKLGCVCQYNQFENSNQCFDCPIECNQCLSANNCIECLITNNRQLKNQQCVCIDGYYPVQSNPQCKLCHQFCKTCYGPTSDDCLTCKNIVNIEQFGQTCRCSARSFFSASMRACQECHSSCLTCFQGTEDSCITCDATLNKILKGLKCICAPGYYEFNSMCTNCPDIEDVLLTQCYKFCINNQYLWHKNECNSCDSGFDLILGECQPICGDQQIIGYEQCEDNNTIFDDLCYNCQFQCPSHCLTCDESTILPCPDICGDGMITGSEECEDRNTIQYDGCFNCKFQCQPSCTKCIKGECFECNTNEWFTDVTVQPWLCATKCGEKTVFEKQCDDGNQVETDGCKDCKYFCRIGCSSCDYITNTCLSCELSGFAPENYYCKNICGDGIVVTDPSGIYTEECDDGNKDQFDGCNNDCRFGCQSPSICQICINNTCKKCAPGYLLNDTKMCHPICGDSIITPDEQCEDGKILPYKGCQHCQAKCQSSCITCDNTGVGCLTCKVGYKRIDNLCYSICGDKIITEDEECDDGNLIFGDGCHQCYFSCPCSMCVDKICVDCPQDHFLYKSTCLNLEDSPNETPIFLFSGLNITQTFQEQSGQTNKIQIKIKMGELFEKVYNQRGQNIEIIYENFLYVCIEINLKCSKDKNIKMQFNRSNYEKRINIQEYDIFTYQCHPKANHIIATTFRLDKIFLRDVIILIRMFEDELKIYAIFEQSTQRLSQITFI